MSIAEFSVDNRTGMNLGKGFEATAAYKGVYISFRWAEVRLQSSDPEKNGRRERRLVVVRQPIGDPSTQSTTHMKPEKAKELYPAEWEYFTKNGEMPMSGTPLSELPGISVSQIQIMQLSGLRSVEDVLSVAEEIINRIGHDGRYVRSVAEEWQRKASENADLTDFAEIKAAQTAALNAANARAERFQRANADLEARLAALEKLLGGNVKGGPQIPDMQAVTTYDPGPDIDSTRNPLAEGTGEMSDDPLED